MSPRIRTSDAAELDAALAAIFATGADAPPIDHRVAYCASLRALSPEHARRLDRMLVEEAVRAHTEIAQIASMQKQLEDMIAKVTAPPWVAARLVDFAHDGVRRRAIVAVGGAHAVVEIAPEAEADGRPLRRGDVALLNAERSLLVGSLPPGVMRSGETAAFVRATGDGRIVLAARDQELVVEVADSIDVAALRPGQPVLWEHASYLALEALAYREADRFFLRDAADIPVGALAGQDAALDRLLWAVLSATTEPEIARLYGVDGRRACLLVGPPGCGKTEMARTVARRIAEATGRRCRFAVVRPGELESPWVGQTQANIRACFGALHDAASDGSVAVLFVDEVDAIGRVRGGLTARHADAFLGAFLAEVDGFAGRGDVFLIAATNRKDALDPALLERLGEVEIHVRRPTLDGARAIFAVHLADDFPFAADGSGGGDARQAIIDTAVSLLFSPNADAEVCRLKFRDGSVRTLRAHELLSGRLIAQMCKEARSSAQRRHVETGAVGIRAADLERALADVLARMSSTITPRNAAAYLDDVSPDNEVVAVERVRRAVPRFYPHLRAA